MLTEKEIRALTEPGRYADARGLYLRVWPSGSKKFYLAIQVRGKRHDLHVGDYPALTLAKAREKADQMRLDLKSGRAPDPAAQPPAAPPPASTAPTFGQLASSVIDDIEDGFRNAKHRAQWRSTLSTYAAGIWDRPVDEIGVAEILDCLRPIWSEKAETAARVRGRMERIFDASIALGLRTAANPASKARLAPLLGKRQKLQRGHHPALPYPDAPTLWAKLSGLTSVSSLALRFTIITAARSGEVRGAAWVEITGDVWTVPAGRMKAGREHRVPLTPAALKILDEVRGLDPVLVFPAAGGRPLSDMALTMCLRGQVEGVTVHGMRSTFRDWAAEETNHQRETIEAALAHAVGDATERAYRRGDALAKRRLLMADYEKFLVQGNQGDES